MCDNRPRAAIRSGPIGGVRNRSSAGYSSPKSAKTPASDNSDLFSSSGTIKAVWS